MFKLIENFLAKINKPIGQAGELIAGGLLVAMTVIVLLQVFCRYLFNTPLSWTDELSCHMMIYMTYLCLPIVYFTDKNIAMTFIIEKIEGTRFSHFVLMLVHTISVILLATWVYFGWNFFSHGNVLANSLPYKMYYIYVAPPILLSLTGLVAVQKFFGELDALINYPPQNTKEAK